MGSLAVGWTAVLFFLRGRTYSRRNVAGNRKVENEKEKRGNLLTVQLRHGSRHGGRNKMDYLTLPDKIN